MKILRYLTFLVITVVINAEQKSFEGAKLFKVTPKTEKEVEILEYMKEAGIGEMWNEYFRVNDDVKVLVLPEMQPVFIGRLLEARIEVTTIIENVQKAIDDQMVPANAQRSSRFLSYDWDSYQNLDTIEKWMEELAREYAGIVSTVSMGIKSVEDREIKGIVINYNPNRQKPLAMLEGTLHAREWISTATVTWIAKELLTSSDPDVRFMAENLEWHIFPVVNPDGYAYTFSHNRMWRKNRSTASFTSCASNGVDDDMSNGVDLNRNFDFFWMSIGASNNSCTNTYAGSSAASEPETQAISEYVLSLSQRGDLIYYIAFHSYTQVFILPYSHVQSHTEMPADNHDHLYEIANRSATRLSERYGTPYRVGIAAEVLYPMSGSSFDWAKHYANASVSYLIELRDLGEYGFLLPSSQIIPNSLEIMDAMIEMDKTTRRLGYYNNSFTLAYSLTLMIAGIAYLQVFN